MYLYVRCVRLQDLSVYMCLVRYALSKVSVQNVCMYIHIHDVSLVRCVLWQMCLCRMSMYIRILINDVSLVRCSCLSDVSLYSVRINDVFTRMKCPFVRFDHMDHLCVKCVIFWDMNRMESITFIKCKRQGRLTPFCLQTGSLTFVSLDDNWSQKLTRQDRLALITPTMSK